MPKDLPACFARLNQVFPLGAEGLREIRPSCRECPEVTPCLRAALDTPEGVTMRAERMEAMESHFGRGPLAFLRRWSELKAIHHAEKEKARRPKK